MTEIVITGMAAVSSAGADLDALWSAMEAAERIPAERLTDPAADAVPVPLCQRIPVGSVPDRPDQAWGLPLGPTTRAALTTARMALRDAALDPASTTRLAVLIASGTSDSAVPEAWRTGDRTPPKTWVPSYLTSSVIGEEFGAQVSVTDLSNACAGSAYALSLGADLIRSGEADVVIAGGAETYSRVTMASFNRLGALDPEGCRPFHRDRKGTALAEGAGVVVLESAAHAAARGARVHGRLGGSGWSCDAYHATAPDPSGEQIVRAVHEALAQSGIGADDVSFVVPHATGTELSDVTECRALHQVFGARTAEIPLYSLKALLGHTGGASGVLSVVAALLMLSHRRMPANLPLSVQDPDCDILLSQSEAAMPGRVALVNAFAFGGHNISLVLMGA